MAKKRASGLAKANAGPSDPPFAVPDWPATTPKLVPLHEIVPYERNPRTHPPEQIALLARLMKDYGVDQAIVVDEANVILKGHGRLLAAQEAGFETFPVVVHRGLTPTQKTAVRIADNQVALLSGWDSALIGGELSELKMSGFDMPLLGFAESQLIGWGVPSGTEGQDAEVAPGPPKHPVVRVGDLWSVGSHSILCGDCTKEDDVRRVVGDNLADMIFTDPPYGVSYKGSSTSDTIAGDITQTAIPISFKQAIECATKEDARIYFCGGSSNVLMYYSLFDAYLRKMPTMIIWNKGSIVMRRNNYHSQYEVIFYGWKGAGGDGANWFGPRTSDFASDVWDVKRDRGVDYLHPTQKPVGLAVRAIGNSAPPGGIVFEPFSGSGSTIIAAEMTGRKALAIEISPAYCQVAIERWQGFTGKSATLDGKTFTEVQRKRQKRGRRKAAPVRAGKEVQAAQ